MLFRFGLYSNRGCLQGSARTPRHKKFEVASPPPPQHTPSAEAREFPDLDKLTLDGYFVEQWNLNDRKGFGRSTLMKQTWIDDLCPGTSFYGKQNKWFDHLN